MKPSQEKDCCLMWRQLLPDFERDGATLQSQLRSAIVTAILDARIASGSRLPSSRSLAAMLSVARNTVVLTLEQLVCDGYLEARPRSGYYVRPRSSAQPEPIEAGKAPNTTGVAWGKRLAAAPQRDKWLEKPADWQRYAYPFVYGQFDPKMFPVAEWRECSRLALSVGEIHNWASDAIEQDDDALVDQLIRRVLPRRGIAAHPSEILITLGTQHALYMLAELLIKPGTGVAIEEPGYMDARNICARRQARIVPVPMGADGALAAGHLKDVSYLYCTPSHHCPSGATLSTERRIALLQEAAKNDVVIIEDDYDAEIQYNGQPSPALKAIDRHDQVVYLGSVSKVISPGLRVGYMVGNPELISAARKLRRLMLRHPPSNNQRALALFIAQGHYDSLLRRTTLFLSERAELLSDAMSRHLPDFEFRRPTGGASIWAKVPDGIDPVRLRREAMDAGVLIESGEPFFSGSAHEHFIRLGYASIALDKIEAGIIALAKVVDKCRPVQVHRPLRRQWAVDSRAVALAMRC